MTAAGGTDFDDWLVSTFDETGAFTMLVVLVGIGGTRVDPLRSAHLHVIGPDIRWPALVALFASARVNWSGAVFFRAGREGLVADAEALVRLAALVRRLHQDRSIIGEGDFFNADGLRLRLEPLEPH